MKSVIGNLFQAAFVKSNSIDWRISLLPFSNPLHVVAPHPTLEKKTPAKRLREATVDHQKIKNAAQRSIRGITSTTSSKFCIDHPHHIKHTHHQPTNQPKNITSPQETGRIDQASFRHHQHLLLLQLLLVPTDRDIYHRLSNPPTKFNF